MATIQRKHFPKRIWLVTALLILLIGSAAGASIWYDTNLRPVSSHSSSRLFTVDEGASAHQIADGLKSLGLIRNPRAFIFYVDSKNYKNKLQAGTYKLSGSMSAKDIAKKIATGDVDKNWLTILPAKRLDQIQQEFITAGYSSREVKSAFETSQYRGDPALASLPKGQSLEGYLYPDSFQKAANTPASVIVRESIDELQSHLTRDIVKGFASQGLSLYQGLTLASVVEQEAGSASSQPTVAQVFLLRFKRGIALGSDVTAFYASALAGQNPSVGIDSPYNTRLVRGLPPGPIGNVTDSALLAVAHPSKTDYLFFVAGDDGVIHFSHTEAEHEAAIKQYCKQLCN